VVFTPLSTIFQLYRGGQFLFVVEAGVSGENERDSNLSTDCIGSYKSNYHTTAPEFFNDKLELAYRKLINTVH